MEKNATGIASAIRLLGFYDHRRDIPWSMWRGKSYVPRTTFVEWAGQYRDCSGYSSLANRLRQGGHLTWSAGIASSYLLYRQVEQVGGGDAFFNALRARNTIIGSIPVVMSWWSVGAWPWIVDDDLCEEERLDERGVGGDFAGVGTVPSG
ncbi:hypothetical protein [Streptomyces sp. NPDC059783]|uniref:hypothetical protein n=1 Tax=Streptomyces sp. NPDC059783 TaxID=3346944 RepID=UPI003660437C